MAQLINNFFGDKVAASSGDADFADFAQTTTTAAATAASAVSDSASTAVMAASATDRPYTKWYNVHERYTWQDFRAEGIIFALIAVVLTLHVIGASLNRAKARAWMRAHAAALASEFALVGFGTSGVPRVADAADETAVLDELARKTEAAAAADPRSLLRESSLSEYATYATGRQNVAFVDVKLKFIKRFNPIMVLAETVVSFFLESVAGPEDVLEAVLYPFDGKEAMTVPGFAGGAAKSTYDGFVWAIVHKDRMKTVRDERFDVSLTFTKDNAKLPAWLTVMSESAEITDALLTPELVQAATAAGDSLDYLIISDQPVDKPTTIDETVPRKRVFLKYHFPAGNDYAALQAIFRYFLRSADVLVQAAHLRPEVLRKVRGVRDETVRQIQKASEEEKAEERAAEREKARKQKRDAELNALDAKAQKKYLEREREKELRRSAKKSTVRA